MRRIILVLIPILLALPLPVLSQEGAQFRGHVITPSPEASTPGSPTDPNPEKKPTITTDQSAAKTLPQKTTSRSKSQKIPKKQLPPLKKSQKTSKESQKKNTTPPKGGLPPQQPKKSTKKRQTTSNPASKAPYIQAKAAYLMNLGTGEVYLAQDPDRLIPPASVTKVMTLYLIREDIARGRLSTTDLIPVSPRAAATGGSSMHLVAGEKAPLIELIKGISVASANNACVAVAEYLGKGNPAAFVARMNATAHALGMRRTVFKNPNGLPAPGQVSTARDLALLARAYLRRFPESKAIHSLTTHTYRGVSHHNANSLLGVYPGADGLKTGFVCASGFNIVATATRGSTHLLAVVLGANSSAIRHRETAKLLDYGFERASHK